MHMNPFASSQYGAPSIGTYGQPWQLQGQQFAPPQQLQQLQQLAYAQQQQLQQLLQIVPAQLQQIQQLIQLVPHQVHQAVLHIVAQQQFGGGFGGHLPQGLGGPFQTATPFATPFAGAPGQVM